MTKTFRIGGIHPPENKLSAGQEIIPLDIPARVIIPMGQHIGTPANPLVQKGAKVKVGTLLGEAAGFISAGVHSPVSGTVEKIDTVIDTSGYKRPAVYIEVEGDEWEEDIDHSVAVIHNCTLSPEQIIRKIATAGIVGMGGATFPTHVKLSLSPLATRAEVLIINAVECEPYLTADHALMLSKSEEILIGISLLMQAVKVQRAIIGIEKNKPDAIDTLSRLAKRFEGIEVIPLKVQYPQGGEKQLIDALLCRQVKSGALPISVGAVVQNIGTAFAVYEAVQKNKPLIERVVTVTGKALAKPSNFKVRIGTPISALINAAGGLPADTGKIIAGGPMMGKTLINSDVPVTKGTSGILLLTKKESLRPPANNCIRCAKCLTACPMGLNPTRLALLTEFMQWDKAEDNHIVDCIECGSCSYTCPAARPLLDHIRLGKNNVMTTIRTRKAAGV
ncbi:MAG: electron transport complex subunit RsxC [Tannerellaceae bacterium]|nr:electron transport complex subunit RsxC [Tannerellaceae bacterium]